MKASVIAGILLIALGVIGLASGGFSYTKDKTIVDIGPLKATTQEKKTIPVPPILGGLALIGGIVLLVSGGKK